MSLKTNGLGWLTGREVMEGNKNSMRVTGLECRNAHHQWDIRRNTFEGTPIIARKVLLSELAITMPSRDNAPASLRV